MRTTIPLTTKPKREGAKPEVRLFTMNQRQSDLFTQVVHGLARAANMPLERAAVEVEKAVVKMFAGRMPQESAPAIFHEMRIAFPILRTRDVRQLPRAGCPRGRVEAVVLQVDLKDTGKRTVLVEFDDDQADFFNDSIQEVMRRDGCTKDEAWLWCCNFVGRLLAGATLKEATTEEVLLMRAVALFEELTRDEVLALPLATEESVRRWSFTLDRAR